MSLRLKSNQSHSIAVLNSLTITLTRFFREKKRFLNIMKLILYDHQNVIKSHMKKNIFILFFSQEIGWYHIVPLGQYEYKNYEMQ